MKAFWLKLRTYLAAFIIFNLIFAFLSFIYLEEFGNKQLEETLLQNDILSDQLASKASRLVGHYSMLVLLIRRNDLFHFEGAVIANPERVSEYFKRVARTVPDFFQIRYLNAEGDEIVRINSSGNDIDAVADADLQNKKDRYYFEEASRLDCSEIYISPLDLNVEEGKVEEPWVPTLRIATPVYSGQNIFQGIIIVNICARQITEMFSAGKGMYLLNQEGYYLAGSKKNELYGFMFNNSHTFALQKPEIWQKVQELESGYVTDREKYYIFKTIHLYDAVTSVEEKADSADDHKWIVLLETDILSMKDVFFEQRPFMSFAVYLLAVIFCFVLVFVLESRRKVRKVQKEHAERIIKLDKLASLGSLVAGISHELNTPIGNSVTIVSTLRDRLKEFAQMIVRGEIRKSEIDAIIRDGDRALELTLNNLEKASHLIGNFKQIATDQNTDIRRTVNIKDFVEEIVETVTPTLKKLHVNIRSDIRINESIETYTGDLSQVLLNIINNAAIHGLNTSGGAITITAEKLEADKLKLYIRDDGCGIEEEHLPHIFKPFYSTKMGSGGSGLGLHIVDNIVTGVLGGSICVETRVGKGTIFSLSLPVKAPEIDNSMKENVYATEH